MGMPKKRHSPTQFLAHVSELEFNVPFQHKHGYIRDDFEPRLLWPYGWIDDTTWYGSRPRPRPHCIRRWRSCPPPKGHSDPLLLAHVYCGHGHPSQLLLSSCTNDRPKKLGLLSGPMGLDSLTIFSSPGKDFLEFLESRVRARQIVATRLIVITGSLIFL